MITPLKLCQSATYLWLEVVDVCAQPVSNTYSRVREVMAEDVMLHSNYERRRCSFVFSSATASCL